MFYKFGKTFYVSSIFQPSTFAITVYLNREVSESGCDFFPLTYFWFFVEFHTFYTVENHYFENPLQKSLKFFEFITGTSSLNCENNHEFRQSFKKKIVILDESQKKNYGLCQSTIEKLNKFCYYIADKNRKFILSSVAKIKGEYLRQSRQKNCKFLH